jgi:hypothetical protein
MLLKLIVELFVRFFLSSLICAIVQLYEMFLSVINMVPIA